MQTQIQTYKDLIVWQKSMLLVEQVYVIAKQLPKEERYILASQVLRAVISIPSNIAEGYLRRHRAEYRHFLSISLGSAAELQTQLLILVKQYPHILCDESLSLVDEVVKMLFVIIGKLENLPPVSALTP